ADQPVLMMRSADSSKVSYASAIAALNQLQSGPNCRAARQRPGGQDRSSEMAQLADLAARVGLHQTALAGLRPVHIAGTKGKGSTAAYTERLLRACGLRTGLFTSPHLVEVRERIRLNGRPISRSEFGEQFWRLHDDLTAATAATSGFEFPRYFRFLTFMALRLFVEQAVDVAIVEVGIGGRYDSTNFIKEPWVCGIASLGHDHTALLGGTLDKIAWHKAGILKPGCIGVTSPEQPAECLPVLARAAAAAGCPIRVSPRLTAFAGFERLGLDGYQQLNAALALQLARLWLRRYSDEAGSAGNRFEPSIRDVIRSVNEDDVSLKNLSKNFIQFSNNDRNRWTSANDSIVSSPTSSNGDVTDSVSKNRDVIQLVSPNNDVIDRVSTNDDVIDLKSTNGDVIDPVSTNGDVIDPVSTNVDVIDPVSTDGDAIEAPRTLSIFALPEAFVDAISSTRWPGRNTIIVRKVPTGDSSECTITFYIDGAHTIESCPLAGEWFSKLTSGSPAVDERVLIFNRTGNRNPNELLESLIGARSGQFPLQFSAGLFCPNLVDAEPAAHPELVNLMVSPEAAETATQQNASAFACLMPAGTETVQLSCLRDAVEWLQCRAMAGHLRSIAVLATGSLHLVGCLLAVLQPEVADGCDA
ncbi:hypothetical protein BOX15_Mlig004125g1, partial [Macrostomum lignano]